MEEEILVVVGFRGVIRRDELPTRLFDNPVSDVEIHRAAVDRALSLVYAGSDRMVQHLVITVGEDG